MTQHARACNYGIVHLRHCVPGLVMQLALMCMDNRDLDVSGRCWCRCGAGRDIRAVESMSVCQVRVQKSSMHLAPACQWHLEARLLHVRPWCTEASWNTRTYTRSAQSYSNFSYQRQK